MNIGKKIAEQHYSNKPNHEVDVAYRKGRVESLEKSINHELEKIDLPCDCEDKQSVFHYKKHIGTWCDKCNRFYK